MLVFQRGHICVGVQTYRVREEVESMPVYSGIHSSVECGLAGTLAWMVLFRMEPCRNSYSGLLPIRTVPRQLIAWYHPTRSGFRKGYTKLLWKPGMRVTIVRADDDQQNDSSQKIIEVPLTVFLWRKCWDSFLWGGVHGSVLNNERCPASCLNCWHGEWKCRNGTHGAFSKRRRRYTKTTC